MALEHSAVNPTTLNLPQGPGSIAGLGEAFTPQLNTGTSSQNFPIVMPPGRNGLQPAIALEYNSGYGNGVLGLGRRLSIPYIQRQTDKGLPHYTEWSRGDNRDNDNDGSIDEFDELDTFVDHNGEELVLIGDNLYRSKNSTSFARYQRLPQGWLITESNGTRLYLGQTAQARVSSEQRNFAWYLEAIEDVQGNWVEYRYKKLDSGTRIYPAEIRYNHSVDGAMSLLFDYEVRPDILTDYKPGFELKTAYRLQQLEIKIADRLLRSYRFSYHPFDNWQSQSLLAEISVSAGGVELPPAQYTYTGYSADKVHIANVPSASRISIDNPNVDFFDMNMDGLPDIISTGYDQDVYQINKGADAKGLPRWSERKEMSTYSTIEISQPTVKWADVDGDGRVNLVAYSSNSIRYFQLDEDLNWQYAGRLQGLMLPLDSPVVKLLDVNNDKRIDVLQTTVDSKGRILSHIAQLNLPEGWSRPISLPMPERSVGVGFNNANVQLADMNGDGLTDLVSIGTKRLVYFPGRGLNGFGEEVVFTNTPDSLYDIEKVRIADMNNDGRSDLVYLNGIRAEIWLNQGLEIDNHQQARFSEQQIVQAPGGLRIREIRLVDINGNGSTDIVWNSPGVGENTFVFAEIFAGEQPHQLKTITNGIGLETTLYYGSLVEEMVRDQEAGRPWSHGVPVAMQVLKKIVVADGISDRQQITSIDYHGGYYNSVEKEFRGFAASEEIRLGDMTAPTLTTAFQYHVGDREEALKGKVKQITTKDTAGKIFWREHQTWDVRKLAEGYGGESRGIAFAAQIERKQTWLEQGRGTPVTLAWSYDYDNYANTIRIEELGRIDGDWQDERITLMRYSAEFSSGQENWILHLPVERKVTDLLGDVVAKEQWFYDDDTFSGANLGQVTKGNLTLRKTWHSPAEENGYIQAERYRYDQYGNRIDSFGPLWGQQPGHHIATTYDELYHSFPIKEEIDTGSRVLTATAHYDAGLGVLTQYTDFNGQVIDFGYDGAGRLLSVTKPGDSLQAPTLSYRYHLAQPVEGGLINWIETRQREQAGGGTLDSRTYYDGLGRTLMTRSEAEQAGQVVVSGQQQFNARGGVDKQYLAYFAQGLDYNPADIGRDVIEYHYDALGRPITTKQPYTEQDKTAVYSRITYEPLSTFIEDEEQTRAHSLHPGAAKRLVYDGLLDENGQGRLRRVDEIAGLDAQGKPTAVSTWSTHYDYDLLGNFTRLKDAQGNVTQMAYDALGRRYFVNDPNRGQHWQFFDAAGNLLATRDANGQERHYRYDGANRLRYEYHLSSGATAAKVGESWTPDLDLDGIRAVVSYQHDAIKGIENRFLLGRLAQVVDQAGFEQLGYDARGRIITRQRKIQGRGIDSPVYTTRLTYDSADRLTRRQFADGTWVDYRYNSRGLLESIPGVVDELDYTAAARLAHSQLSNGVNTNWAFDERHRLVSLKSIRNQDGLNLQQLDYQFDAVSNLLEVTDRRSADTLKTLAGELKLKADKATLLSQTFSYAYDDLYRLTDAGVDLSQYQYRYDLIGNLLEKTDSRLLSDPHSTLFRYGGSADSSNRGAWNRVGRATQEEPGPQALTWADGPIAFDANGNQIKQGDWRYQWDADNRLIAVTSPEASGYYGYDYQNKRRYKVVERQSGAHTQVLYLDDSSELRNGQMVKYVWLGDKRVARSVQNGGAFTPSQYYLHNHLGSTALTLNWQGEVLNAFSYKPYGELEQQFGATGLAPYRFAGKEQDNESGLGYFERRYLQANHGRFLTPDPVFELPGRFGDPQRWSPYAYARNNPVGYLDPNGESIVKAGVTAGKLAWKAYKQYRKTGKFDKASLKKVGMDELVGITDDLNTVFLDANASILDKLSAATDLIAGTEFSDGELSDFRPGAKPGKKGVCCFVAGTLVLTQDGYKAIETIELGERVWSKDVKTGEQGWKPVTQLFKKHRRIYELVVVSASGDEKRIDTTDDHPFYVLGRKWVDTVDLLPGDQIETEGYGWVVVQAVRDAERYDATYNLEVADFHTYYATRLNLLVHNCTDVLKGEKSLSKTARPDIPEKKALDVLDKTPKQFRGQVFDIMETLPKALANRNTYRSWFESRRDHPLTGNLKGWRSLDLVPGRPGIAGSKFRFLYKETKNGIEYMVRDTH